MLLDAQRDNDMWQKCTSIPLLYTYQKYGPVIQEMLFNDIYYLELWQPLCSVELNHLCNFGRAHHEEQFCEIILNLDQ